MNSTFSALGECDYCTKMALSGIMAVLIETVIDQIQFRLHLVENSIITYVAAILLPDNEQLNKFSAQVVGLIGHLIMGAGFGVIIGIVLLETGTSQAYIKGMGIGAFYWLLIHRALTSKFWVKEEANVSSISAAVELIKHFIIGILTVAFSYWLKSL